MSNAVTVSVTVARVPSNLEYPTRLTNPYMRRDGRLLMVAMLRAFMYADAWKIASSRVPRRRLNSGRTVKATSIEFW